MVLVSQTVFSRTGSLAQAEPALSLQSPSAGQGVENISVNAAGAAALLSPDSLKLKDSLLRADSLRRADSLVRSDSLRRNGLFPGVVPDSLLRPADTVYHKPFLDDVISGKNEDSLVYQVQKKIVYIYEKGDVKYQKMNLKADFMRINMDNKEIYAYGRPDTVQLKEPTEAGDTVKNFRAMLLESNESHTDLTDSTDEANVMSKKSSVKQMPMGVETSERDLFISENTKKKSVRSVKSVCDIRISPEEYAEWAEKICKIGVKEEVLDAISAIRKSLRAVNVDEAAERRNIYVSDRRWKNIVRLLRTSAFMQDREEVDICDLLPIYHCLWQEPEERDAIRSIVIRALFSPFAEKLVEMKNALAEDIKYHRVRRNPDDGRDYEGEIETLSDGLTSLERQLGENLFVSSDDKAEISAYLRDFYKELAFTRQDTMKLYEV